MQMPFNIAQTYIIYLVQVQNGENLVNLFTQQKV